MMLPERTRRALYGYAVPPLAVFFALAISTLAKVFRARWESDNKLPFSRQQGFAGRAPHVGHLTSCALSFIAIVYAMP